jgi:hypothetical protein
MAAIIKIKNSSTAGAVPTSGDLVQGELAVNVTDKRIFTENASGTVVELGTNPTSLNVKTATGGVLTLATSDTIVSTGDVLGGIDFQAPNEASGSQAILVGASISAVASVANFNTTNNNTDIVFSTNETGASPTERVRITSSGNVGIGTDAPATPLHVYKTSGTSSIRVASGSATGEVASLQFYGTDSGSAAQIYSQIVTGVTTNTAGSEAGYIGFETTNAGSTTEKARITSSGNVGIGTDAPTAQLHIVGSDTTDQVIIENTDTSASSAPDLVLYRNSASPAANDLVGNIVFRGKDSAGNDQAYGYIYAQIVDPTSGSEDSAMFFETAVAGAADVRMMIDSSGNYLFKKVATSNTTDGVEFRADVSTTSATFIGDGSSGTVIINRQGSDGTLLTFRQANTTEGSISVSGTTVSYNGGHLARWAQTIGAKDESLKKGTVLSNLDEMNTYTDAEGNPIANEQLNKVKVSDVEGDVNVAGVFVNWSHDEDHNVDEINMAMTGDMIIRIAQGTTVARGDLLMSAGDGTAKPQGDDIVRAKTVAKVTSTHVTCTYEDGSYCVPCVLMAC